MQLEAYPRGHRSVPPDPLLARFDLLLVGAATDPFELDEGFVALAYSSIGNHKNGRSSGGADGLQVASKAAPSAGALWGLVWTSSRLAAAIGPGARGGPQQRAYRPARAGARLLEDRGPKGRGSVREARWRQP